MEDLRISKHLKTLESFTGVRSEPIDVKSVLKAKDVQEESEEAEGLVPAVSSSNAFSSSTV